MTTASTVTIHNAQAIPFCEVPELWIGEFRRTILNAVTDGCRIISLSGLPRDNGHIKLLAVLANDNNGTLSILSTIVKDAYPALTTECPQAQGFERELAETFGLRPEGHPWLKPRSVSDQRCHTARRNRFLQNQRRRGPRGRCRPDFMPALSNPAIFVFSVTAKRSSIWKSRWAISIAASNAPSSADLTCERFTTWKPPPAIQPPPRLPLTVSLSKRSVMAASHHTHRSCGPSLSNWNDSPIIPAIWARWPATSGICPRHHTAAGFAGIFSI